MVSILAAWSVVALVVAVLLGRAAARADREELGIEIDWDHLEMRGRLVDSPPAPVH